MIGENKRRLKKNMSTVSIIEKTGGENRIKLSQYFVKTQSGSVFTFYHTVNEDIMKKIKRFRRL